MSAAEWTVIGEGASAEPNGMVVVRCPLPPAQDAGSSTEMEVKIRIRHKAVEEEVKTEKVKEKASVLASAEKVVEKAAPSRPAPNPPRAAAGYLDLLRGVLGPLCPAVTTAEVYYLVLKNDHQPSLRGLWSGAKATTWAKVLTTLKGGQLFGSGARLRRVHSLEDAREMWAKESGEPMAQWIVEG